MIRRSKVRLTAVTQELNPVLVGRIRHVQHTIRPRWNALLARRVVHVTALVEFIRRAKVQRPFLKVRKDIACFHLAVQLIVGNQDVVVIPDQERVHHAPCAIDPIIQVAIPKDTVKDLTDSTETGTATD